jgi:hypothetical protein
MSAPRVDNKNPPRFPAAGFRIDIVMRFRSSLAGLAATYSSKP